MIEDHTGSAWDDALQAARLFAVDPAGTGGVLLRALPGVARERWLQCLRHSLPAGAPLRRIPLHISDSRLLGGLDLAATLRAGRAIGERGVLAEADGGVVLLAMAERVPAATAARIAAALDAGEVVTEREGLALNSPSRIGVVALDEGISTDEQVAEVLRERLAFCVDLSGSRPDPAEDFSGDSKQIEAARARRHRVGSSAEIQQALCATALALGIPSIRAVLQCHAVARAAAALAGRDEIAQSDAELAARLVLAPRATALPAIAPNDDDAAPQDDARAGDDESVAPADQPQPSLPSSASPPQGDTSGESADEEQSADQPFADVVLAAAIAAIPAGLLAQLRSPAGAAARSRSSGRAGALGKSSKRGRPAGTIAGEPRAGVRLSLIETLRAAAPWQRLRRLEKSAAETSASPSPRIQIRRADFRIGRYQQRSQTTTIFVLDASGSAALNRLAEAKGAVELLLSDCYVRRDRVAVIAFRGRTAELLLPPTRSLARAKRSLAGLPGGGGTPLATGIDAALDLALSVHRAGDSPTLVLLTDGRANVTCDGSGDRQRAEAEAYASARRLRAAGFNTLFIDTSPRPQPAAARLAEEMRANYLALPHAGADSLAAAVKSSSAVAGLR